MPDGSEQRAFTVQGEDAYRGRPLVSRVLFPPSRSDGTPKTDQGATFRAERVSARRRGDGREIGGLDAASHAAIARTAEVIRGLLRFITLDSIRSTS